MFHNPVLFRNFLLLVFSLVMAAGFTSCKRAYEDGPSISFVSREARVINTWQATKVLRNDYDGNNIYDKYEMNFEKGGTTPEGGNFKWTVRYKGDTTDLVSEGKWKFATKERQIRLEMNGTTNLLYMDITRLLNQEMWIKYQIENDYYTVYLNP